MTKCRPELLDDRTEQATQCRESQYFNLFGGELAANLHCQGDRQFTGQHTDEQAQLADQIQPGRHFFADDSPADIDRVGHEFPGQRQLHARGDVGSCAILSLAGGRTEVWRDDNLRQIEQRAVGGRLLREHVDARGPNVPRPHRLCQRFLVDQPAPSGVDDDDARLRLRQRLRADQAGRLGRLGQVHRDEVGAGQQLVEGEQLDAQLRRARR